MNFTHLIIAMILIHWNITNTSKIAGMCVFQKFSFALIQIEISLFKDGVCEEFEAELNYCGCKRKIKTPALDPNTSGIFWYNQTTCSMDAFKRGMGQKIIGVSLYGDYNLRKL